MSTVSDSCPYCGKSEANLWGGLARHVAVYHTPHSGSPVQPRPTAPTDESAPKSIAIVAGAVFGGALGFLIPIIVLSSGDVGMALYFAACQAGGCAALVVAIIGGATAAGALFGALIAAALGHGDE